MDGVIKLIRVVNVKDKYGASKPTETVREIFCDVQSVYSNEFHAAGQNGIKPEYRLAVFPYDYDGETVVEYEGKRYSVYRTFRRDSDHIELYVERKTGSV